MKFKIGDRVAVYGYTSPAEGGSCYPLHGAKGTVIGECCEGFLEIQLDMALPEQCLDNPRRIDMIHPKQCRRLVKRTSVWVNLNSEQVCYLLPVGTEKPQQNVAASAVFVTDNSPGEGWVRMVKAKRQ